MSLHSVQVFSERTTSSTALAVGSTEGSARLVSDFLEGQAFVYVSELTTGSPTLTVTVETSYDSTVSNSWATIATFDAISAVPARLAAIKLLTNMGKYVRFYYTVGGTGTIKFASAFVFKS